MDRKLKKDNKTGKCHGSRMFADLKDDKAVEKILRRFDAVGINLQKPIEFEKKPWYRYEYSNVINAVSEMLTFYIPVEVKKKIEITIGKNLSSGDRLLLKINRNHLLIVKLSKTCHKFCIYYNKRKSQKLWN
ncbi:MAG: hypothetical protein QXQ77_02930 [Candidatus Aenigmatarchaeota archaeon]